MGTGPGAIDTNGIWRFGEDDSETLMSDTLNLGQETVSDQFTLDRGRITTLESRPSGLVRVIPTAPSAGVTVGTQGKVSFTAVSAVSITCFTSLYDNYSVVLNYVSSGSSSGKVRLRSGATDLSTSTYDFQLLQGGGTSATAVRTNATSAWETMGVLTASTVAVKMDFFSPALASKTLFDAETTAYATNDPWVMSYRCGERGATAYTGFTFYPSAGTFTGSLRIYGHYNG